MGVLVDEGVAVTMVGGGAERLTDGIVFDWHPVVRLVSSKSPVASFLVEFATGRLFVLTTLRPVADFLNRLLCALGRGANEIHAPHNQD